MKTYRKSAIYIFLMTVMLISLLQPALASTSQSVSKTQLGFQDVLEKAKNDAERKSLIIFQDETRDFVLFYLDGKLQSYKARELTKLDSSYSFNYSAIFTDPESGLLGSVQVSPDKNLIVFYDALGTTFIYSVERGLLSTLPVSFGKVVWNAAGNDFDFVFKQMYFREGMSNIFVYPTGLYIKNTDGSLKQIIDDSKSVEFVGNRADGIHFTVQSYRGGFDFLYQINKAWKEEIVYDIKTGTIRYVPHLPDNIKVVLHNNMADSTTLALNNLIIPDYKIYFNGNYVLAPAGGKYIRLNKVTGNKKLIPEPIGIYKGKLYYFKTPHTSGPVYKMDINTLVPSKTSIGYAASYGYKLYKNNLYFLNSRLDAKGYIVDVPYACNLDNGKLVKNAKAPLIPAEYHVFILKNNYRLCVLGNGDTVESAHLEDSNGRIILPDVMEYSGGFFYQTGLSKDQFPVINKIDINGKIVKTLYKAYNKYAQITALRVSGNKLFFTIGSNLYSSDVKTGISRKY